MFFDDMNFYLLQKWWQLQVVLDHQIWTTQWKLKQKHNTSRLQRKVEGIKVRLKVITIIKIIEVLAISQSVLYRAVLYKLHNLWL